MHGEPIAWYSFRRSVLEELRTYLLYPDRLEVDGFAYPLRDVLSVHLKYERTKQRGYYQCLIRTRSARISLRHVHWRGFNDFQDQRATYTPFVRAVLDQLAPYPNVRYKAGSMVNFVAAILGVPLMGGLGYLAYSMERNGSASLAGLMLVICLAMIGPSRPRRFDPQAPPADLLP